MNADNLMSSSNGILNWFVSLFLDYLKKNKKSVRPGFEPIPIQNVGYFTLLFIKKLREP